MEDVLRTKREDNKLIKTSIGFDSLILHYGATAVERL